MLTAYQTAVTNLIQAPSSPVALIPPDQLTTYINTARQQLAGDAECIRRIGSLSTIATINEYTFPMIGGFDTGISGVISIQNIYVLVSANLIEMRPWAWFQQYYLRSTKTGAPTVSAQLQQGTSGSFFLYPIPDAIYSLRVDSVCLPVNLIDDTTVEDIPALWTDAVPFYAAWLAMMSLQRQADADEMLSRYKELALRGRQEATSEVLPDNYAGGVGATIASSKTTLARMPSSGRGGP